MKFRPQVRYRNNTLIEEQLYQGLYPARTNWRKLIVKGFKCLIILFVQLSKEIAILLIGQ